MPFSQPRGLNHIAYPTWDTEATRRFYTDLLGMPLVGHAIGDEASTGSTGRFIHTFFQMADGSCLAFFEVEGMDRETAPSPIPSWVRHVALTVGSLGEVQDAKRRLEAAGVEVRGIVDHEGIWSSIYFFDPNGVRLELTYQKVPLSEQHAREAEEAVAAWAREHRGQADGQAQPERLAQVQRLPAHA